MNAFSIVGHNKRVTYTKLEQLYGNTHTNGAHKKDNYNNPTPIFIGSHKITQKTWTLQKGSTNKVKR
jgi:hypothetical protein